MAWALPAATRDALHEVIGARRDIRRFRPDAVPADVLERVLRAGHAAPSVGHSQPWRFLVVDDAELRTRAAVLADGERLAQASQLDGDSARRLLDLQLEGIREAPLGVVVCCDRRTAAAGVLGRATFPDADVWSCACAVQNVWLAARAEGLGLGWVTLFRPQDLAGLLGLPDGVVTLGWLCLGWPDERPRAGAGARGLVTPGAVEQCCAVEPLARCCTARPSALSAAGPGPGAGRGGPGRRGCAAVVTLFARGPGPGRRPGRRARARPSEVRHAGHRRRPPRRRRARRQRLRPGCG